MATGGGGTWTGQNKIRPGVYIRFRSTGSTGLTAGDRGTVTICEPMSWGPVGKVMEIEAGADMTPYTGYDITNPRNRFLNEIFKGSNRTAAPRKVLLYRPAASSSSQASATAGALTATARYPGARGNDITIVITALAEPEDSFTVSTIVDGEPVDQQTAATADALEDNGWVTFSGTGALTAETGKALEGGADGTVQSAAYSAYLTAIEPYPFDVMIYDGTDTTVQSAMVAFIWRIAEETGVYAQLVAAGLQNPDSRFVLNVSSGVTLADGTELTAAQTAWWVGGATAGALYNQDLTYAAYPDAVAVSPKLTNSQYEAADQAGKFTLWEDNGVVKVEYDLNSLVTYTADVGEVFRYNRTMRLCNTVANDIRRQFADNFIGVVNNNADGRARFKSVIVGYLLNLQANQGIQDFTADDVEVLPGEAKDAIVVNIAINAVGSVNKIYITLEVS